MRWPWQRRGDEVAALRARVSLLEARLATAVAQFDEVLNALNAAGKSLRVVDDAVGTMRMLTEDCRKAVRDNVYKGGGRLT